MRDLCAQLRSEFEVEDSMCRDEVEDFLTQLLEAELVEVGR
jgi:hypothetical protein